MEANKRVNTIKGIAAGLILLLGIGILLAFNFGLSDSSLTWIFITIVIGAVVVITVLIFILPSSRIEKLSRSHEYRTDQYKREEYETVLRRKNIDFTPTAKMEKISEDKIRYCDYCGIQIQKGTKICSNCGQKLD